MGRGLQGRLLAGLAVLVVAAIASTGWLTAWVARRQLAVGEEDRAQALVGAVTALVERSLDPAQPFGSERNRARLVEVTRSLEGVGGIRDLTLVDVDRRVVVGAAASLGGVVEEPGFTVALRVGGRLTRPTSDGGISFYAPLRAGDGKIVGALRLRAALGETVTRALSSSVYLLVGLTLVDAFLVLLFGALFIRQVVRPLKQLAAAAARVAAGDLDVPSVASQTTAADGEVGELARAFDHMTASLREQRASLAASREQVVAQEKLVTVGRLAAGVAHEVGNPLTAILGYVELLRDPGLSDDTEGRRDLVERIGAETSRIHRIVHDLLEYARPVASDADAVRLDDVCTAAIGLLRPQPRFRDIAVTIALPADLPPVATSSPRLLQVLLNLLLNAADAGSTTVEISARVVADRVELDVSDDGPGVPAPDVERIFDPFYTTKEPGAGTGLGLAVCRSIITAFAGTIAVAPPSDRPGARFRITLRAWT